MKATSLVVSGDQVTQPCRNLTSSNLHYLVLTCIDLFSAREANFHASFG